MKKTRNWLAALVMVGMVLSLTLPAFADLEITFNTSDAPGPQITTITPAANTVNLPLGTQFYVLLQDGGSGFYPNLDNSSAIQLFNVTDSVLVSTNVVFAFGSGNNTTVTPTSPLLYNKVYRLQFTEAASGLNHQKAANAPYWNDTDQMFEVQYTTSSVFNITSTDIGGVSGGATGGQAGINPVNVVLKVLMTSALDANSLTSSTVKLYEGTSSGTQVTGLTIGLDGADGTNKTIKVEPGTLKYNKTYTLVLKTGASGILTPTGATLAP